jgi:hypothetical protein
MLFGRPKSAEILEESVIRPRSSEGDRQRGREIRRGAMLVGRPMGHSLSERPERVTCWDKTIEEAQLCRKILVAALAEL